MATQIRPNRLEVSDRFPMLGFTVRTDGNAKRYEIAIGTSPDLFGPDGKSHRNRSNFYSTRATGPLPIERGEAVFVLPAEVLARFVGQAKLYYGLATGGNGAGRAEVVTMPGSGSPYVNISGLSGRSLQRVRLLPSRQRLASNYGKAGTEMEWAGDTMTPGTQAAAPPPAKDGAKDASSSATPAHYDDGYGPLPPAPVVASKPETQPQAKSLADDVVRSSDDDQHGIKGPVPDAYSSAQGYVRPLAVSPEYPGASRFEPSPNFKRISGTRTINRIVIHITDGWGKTDGTISWFKDPKAQVSAHYIVGQDGEVVQMVKHNDIAWHASSANGDSIGIEHEARSPHEFDKKLHHEDPGLFPTDIQYCNSAALVNWLCNEFNIPVDRVHILGHNEADPKNPHPDCPTGVWDWDYYMGLLTSGTCTPRDATASSVASALEGGQSFDENWNDVDVIGQPENYSCWATAASMVVGWRAMMSLDIQALKKLFTGKTGVSSDTGLYAYDDQKLADALGLVAEPPQCYNVDGFRRILENYGPLWVGIHTEDNWGHAVVVTGLYGDGTPDNTYVRIHDPWGRSAGTPVHPGSHNPTPGQGSRYTLTYSEFQKEYECQASSTNGNVNVQILHAADNGGRTIGIGTDQSYALAASWTKPPRSRTHQGSAQKTKVAGVGTAKPQTHATGAAAQAADDATPQPVQLPAAKRLTGWEKQLLRGAVDALVAAGVPPVSTVLPLLIHLVNDQGFSVGIGLGGDAGLLGGAGLSFGVILAPNDDVGVFGSVEISAGLLAGISGSARVIVIRGGIDAFNETGYAAGVTLEPELAGVGIPVEGTVVALFNSQKQFHGVSFRLGVGEALSPIQIFTSTEKSVSKAVTQSLAAADEDSQHGIEGPIPDGAASAQSLTLQSSLTPRWEPANRANYSTVSGKRTINRIVIHITDSGPDVEKVIKHFKDPAAQASVHYIIAQDGEVVQMVNNNNTAWHAMAANEDSIGIDHVARQPRVRGPKDPGLPLTKTQLCVSGQLVNILCNQFNIPIDREHIVGHEEADPNTQHKGCPNAMWKWDQYMDGVRIEMDDPSMACRPDDPNIYAPVGIPGGAKGESLSLSFPPPRRKGKSLAMDAGSQRSIANSPVSTVTGGEGNIAWELDQFPGVKMAAQSAVAPMQSAETIQLSNWPYCDHANGGRAAAWFTVDWKFSGQALGQVRISPSGTQQGPQPLRVEARIEDGKNRDASTVSLVVHFTYHFSTADGPEVVALTDLVLYSDGSIDQRSNWTSRVAA